MKKMVSVALTLVMAFAMALTMKVTTFAASKTFTITAPDNNHTYEVYQIFTGDVSGKTLSNVKWGKNGTETEGTVVSDTVLDAIKNLKTNDADQTKLNTIKNYVNLKSDPYKTVSKKGSVEVPQGYYLIKDKDNSLTGKDDAYTTYIVKVSENLTIEPKAEKPSSEKKVKDTNDTTGDTTGWQDSADYDIGDDVPFQLTGTVIKDKYADYKVYKFVFHDQESEGLTFNKDSVKVYVDGKQITTGYEVTTSPKDGHTFDVVFADLKKISEVKAGSKITVEYTSKLNDKAVLGSAGNPNKMHLEYSNNPNDEQGGETGKTPDDTVIVFTYKTVINKIDSEGNPLQGAEFTLEKVLSDGSTKTVGVIKNAEGTTFTFKGLDDGDYILKETQTPEGYNTISDIKFTITANHDVLSDAPELKDLTGNKVSGEITLTPNKTEGSLTSDIVNKKGSELPETGGMGTTVMYLVGGVLVAGAALLLITKRRMDADR